MIELHFVFLLLYFFLLIFSGHHIYIHILNSHQKTLNYKCIDIKMSVYKYIYTVYIKVVLNKNINSIYSIHKYKFGIILKGYAFQHTKGYV